MSKLSSVFFSSVLFDSVPDGSGEPNLGSPKSPSYSDQKQTHRSCKTLKERGLKFGFDVDYYDLPDKGYSGNHQCFVKLSTSPLAVCCGSGPTELTAHEEAAHNALQYLDVVPAKG